MYHWPPPIQCVWGVVFGVDSGLGWLSPWCPPEHWGCSDLAVALSCVRLPLPLLRFVQGSEALLTGEPHAG